jgi:hypothetical protein
MSLFLLLLGAATSAAGFILIASGVVIHDGAFDTETVTPGTIAAVGGLLLVGMGLAVRELQRIERALAARSGLRPARPSDAFASVIAEPANSPGRLPFPPKPKANVNQPSAPHSAHNGSAPPEVASLESLRAKLPGQVQIESAPVAEESTVALLARTPIRAEEAVGEVRVVTAVARAANGAAPTRAVSRLGGKARPSVSPAAAGGSAFNAFWPARPGSDARTASAEVAAPAPPPLVMAPIPAHEIASDASPEVTEVPAAVPLTVLKSGVVEGMAYTLYSDGSIEAQLPQGTLRFGSITALRDHIESAS